MIRGKKRLLRIRVNPRETADHSRNEEKACQRCVFAGDSEEIQGVTETRLFIGLFRTLMQRNLGSPTIDPNEASISFRAIVILERTTREHHSLRVDLARTES